MPRRQRKCVFVFAIVSECVQKMLNERDGGARKKSCECEHQILVLASVVHILKLERYRED